MDITLAQLLKTMIEQKASDLHITTGSPPQLRINGRLYPLKTEPLMPSQTKRLCYEALNESQRATFEEYKELDLSFGVPSLGRFRANIYMQRGAVTGAFRFIPFEIPSMENLGLPVDLIKKICEKPRGLVLVTGPTGSGKSTTLASMIDYINSTRRGHILTIEDPIEYLHKHKKCLVNQREVGQDTSSFSNALRYLLRQDPDVVLVGEMRDLETIEAALTISETGHLLFATLHTNNAIQAITRIIDVFPPHQQTQVRAQLSFVLEAVISQQLVPKIGGKGRVLAYEMLVPNSAVRNLIREDKLHQIYSQMQIGQNVHGMQTMNQTLAHLVVTKQIALEEAVRRATDTDELKSLFTKAGIAWPKHVNPED